MTEENQELYVRRRGRVEGPWPLEKIRSEIKLRKLGRHDELSFDGEQWISASKFGDLFPKTTVRSKNADGGASDEQAGEVNAAKPWHCYIGEEKRGPMSQQELENLIRDGSLVLDDLVWRDGFVDWLELEKVGEFAHLFEPSSRISSDSADETRIVNEDELWRRKRTSSLAVWGMILSFLPPACCGATTIGVILCIMALVAIRKNKEELGGGGLAITGIIVGIIWILIAIIALIVGAVAGVINS